MAFRGGGTGEGWPGRDLQQGPDVDALSEPLDELSPSTSTSYTPTCSPGVFFPLNPGGAMPLLGPVACLLLLGHRNAPEGLMWGMALNGGTRSSPSVLRDRFWVGSWG